MWFLSLKEVAVGLVIFSSLSASHDVESREPDLSWRDHIKHSVGHQNPAVAPPVVAPPLEDLAAILESKVAPSQGVNNSVSVSPRAGSLFGRDGGPLYCTNGPCVDDSCCGPKGICGYGPDFCGTGCTSKCDALAMCGQYSEDANMPCGMNLCCSATGWCGTTNVYCNNADPAHLTLPCQAGYGSCAIYGAPSCSETSGSSSRRKIGYYQSWNVRERLCNKVSPSQLNTTGYTHLFYAFAFIDPNTFRITPGHNDDLTLMKDFTKLQTGSLKTWIAIGGFDFSDIGPTHTTWSDMVSTKANRAAFISSVKDYMDLYGFSGVDLDWEYPGDPVRGGNKLADVRNFPALLREMRAAYGTKYGISLTLAPDYWYLRWFDAKAMESSVDFFGFMAYDLHGSWDTDVKALGKIVRGQADVREIRNDTMPLWFDNLDPAKINFGLAMYGRGYTLADRTCNNMLCPFSGPSKPAPCTGQEGVMSLLEIKQLIKERNIQPKYLPDAMMKQLTWDDQWIGYDDEETFAAKQRFANSMCFGGTMVWSIDFQASGSGGLNETRGDVVYLAPDVYSGTPAQCTAPCLFVLPPRALPAPTTISIAPYVTSLELGPGTTTTITVTVPAITTASMDYYNYQISSGQATTGYTFTPTASLSVSPITTTLKLPGGATQVRTLHLPPWPAITNPSGALTTVTGKPPSSSSNSAGTSGIGGFIGWPDFSNTPPAPPEPTVDLPVKPPYTPPPNSPTTLIPSSTPTWPVFEIIPVQSDVPEGGQDDDGDGPKSKSTCKLWFFFICVKWDDFNIKIGGWEWNMPVGIWGPGPPPIANIKLPPGFTLKGTLPRWPKITVLPGGKVVPPSQPADCTPAQASLCYTTSSFATTVSKGATKTTATQVKSTCATITGCNFKDVEATKSVDACKLARRTAAYMVKDALPKSTGIADPYVEKRATNKPKWVESGATTGAFLIPRTPFSAVERQAIEDLLTERDTDLICNGKPYGHTEVYAKGPKWTAYWRVENVGAEVLKWFDSPNFPEIAFAYAQRARTSVKPRDTHIKAVDLADNGNVTLAFSGESSFILDNMSDEQSHVLAKRAFQSKVDGNWHLSQIATPPNIYFDVDDNRVGHFPHQDKFYRQEDDSLGVGQTAYIVEAGWLPGATEYASSILPPLPKPAWIPQTFYDGSQEDIEHGFLVMSYFGGANVGVAKNTKMVHVPYSRSIEFGIESILFALVSIADDLEGKGKNTAVINMSLGSHNGAYQSILNQVLQKIMFIMEGHYGVVFVTGAGNDGVEVVSYPQVISRSLAGMLVVVANTKNGDDYSGNNRGDVVNARAPGVNLPKPPNQLLSFYTGLLTGTSLASPQVAALVCIFRNMQNGPKAPAEVKVAINHFHRRLIYSDMIERPSSIWSGMQRDLGVPTCKRDLYGRQACSLPGGGSPDTSPLLAPPIQYRYGPPAPLCKEKCGTLCSGYFCAPIPRGPNPDFVLPTGGIPAPVPTTPVTVPTKPTTSPTAVTSAPGGGGNNPQPTVTSAPAGGGGLCTATAGAGYTWSYCSCPSMTLPTMTATNKPCGYTALPSACRHGGSPKEGTEWCNCDDFPYTLPVLPTSTNQCGYTSLPKPYPYTYTDGSKNIIACATSSVSNGKTDCAGPVSTVSKAPDPAPSPPPLEPLPPCITIHSFLYNNWATGDGIGVVVWENGEVVCDGQENVVAMSSTYVSRWDCKNGGKLVVTDNAHDVKYYPKDNGVVAQYVEKDGVHDWDLCGETPNGGSLKCWWFEYTFFNSYCKTCAVAQMCGATDCPKFNPKC